MQSVNGAQFLNISLFFSLVCLYCCCFSSSSNNFYGTCNKYLRMSRITYTLLSYYRFKFNLTVGVPRSTSIIIYFDPIFRRNLMVGLLYYATLVCYTVLFDIPLLYYYINLKPSIILCLSSAEDNRQQPITFYIFPISKLNWITRHFYVLDLN